MSKEYLEALKRIRQETCPATYMDDFDKNECCDVIEQALLRLEAIDNANPSEALECLEEIKNYFPFVDLDKGKEYVCEKEFNTIKQALLKAEKEHNSVNLLMQELDCKDFAELRKYARCGYEKINKKYLKWEDLEFDDEWKYQEVKLNGTKYTIKYKCDFDFFDNYYEVIKIYNQDKRKQLFKLYNNEQFFNDLHLERVEE